MDKAERGTGGAFVNVIAYKADYTEVREDLKLIREPPARRNAAARTIGKAIPRFAESAAAEDD